MKGKFIMEKPKELARFLGDANDNIGTIITLLENKAKKEGVTVDEIKKNLSPLLILIPSKEQKKTD